MNFFKLIVGLFILAIASTCMNKQQNSDSKFQGMWKLDKIEAFDSLSSEWKYYETDTYTNGYILYDGLGHMGVHLTPKGYEDFEPNKNIDSLDIKGLKDLVTFYKSNFVYFADYKIIDSSIAHYRLSATNPVNWGTTLTRDFEFRNDTLILTAHENIKGKKLRLRWIKM